MVPRNARKNCWYANAPAVVICLLASVAAGNSSRADDAKQPISFALSGGASKGAYEAGLTWAVIAVTRSVVLPAAAGTPREIELTSIAGTSAGGITALLAGLAWCVRDENEGGFPNRIDDNIFRNAWLTPGINSLLPPDPGSPPYLPDDAALSRQSFEDFAAEVMDMWRQPGTFRNGCRIPMGFTVTRTVPAELLIGDVVAVNQRFHIPFDLTVQEDGSAGFMFDPTTYPGLNDPTLIPMPWNSGSAEFSVSDEQVLNTIYSTSAYPTGFGRRRVAYCQLAEFSPDSAAPLQSATELRCPQGYDLTEAEFADGGLFDNLPLGLARTLTDNREGAHERVLPTSYLYLDPNQYRFDRGELSAESVCEGEVTPEACQTQEFSFGSEIEVVRGFLGTARKYGLYLELTNEAWQSSLPELSYALADIVTDIEGGFDCPTLQSHFDDGVDCSDALIRAGRFLGLLYGNSRVPIRAPMSHVQMTEAGLASDCESLSEPRLGGPSTLCSIDVPAFRARLAAAQIDIAARSGPDGARLIPAIGRSADSVQLDRSIVLTTVGAPITGQLLGAFGAFLDRRFREYDYYVGIYDAIFLVAQRNCGLRFSSDTEAAVYAECMAELSQALYDLLGISNDPTGQFVFALLAEAQYSNDSAMSFAANEPILDEDRNIRIIHDGLDQVLRTTRAAESSGDGVFIERGFFEYLRDEGYSPTPPRGGGEPLLAIIIDEPDAWAYELTKRWTTRLVHLEQQADEIFEARDPDSENRETARTGILGAGAWGLQTATYQYPGFAFAPSTAPKAWIWRNFIPYEVGFDLVEGDMTAFWQPTWNIGNRTNLGVRFGLGFAGGLFRSSEDRARENYATLGFDVTFLSRSNFVSSFGFTPAVYHTWNDPEVVDQTTYGLEVHAGFLNNRLRVAIGARDLSEFSNTWLFSLSVADLPGMLYWMTR